MKPESNGPLSDLLEPELSDKNDNKSDNKVMEEGAAKRTKLAGASTDFLSDLNNFLESSFEEEIDEDQKTGVTISSKYLALETISKVIGQ